MQQSEEFTEKYILLIDLDGTLIESDYANFLSYQEAIYQITGTKINYVSNERFTRRTLKNILPVLSQLEFDKIVNLKNKIFFEKMHLTNLNIELLDVMKKYSQNHKLVLATKSHKERAISLLEYYNLSSMFEYMFFEEDFEKLNEKNKVLYVLNYLNISPKSLIVFENEESVIKDALSVGVPNKNICNCSKGANNE